MFSYSVCKLYGQLQFIILQTGSRWIFVVVHSVEPNGTEYVHQEFKPCVLTHPPNGLYL